MRLNNMYMYIQNPIVIIIKSPVHSSRPVPHRITVIDLWDPEILLLIITIKIRIKFAYFRKRDRATTKRSLRKKRRQVNIGFA